MREWSANYQNERLAEADHVDRVDHRSLIDQGIARLPQRHLGAYSHRLLTGKAVHSRATGHYDIRVEWYMHVQTLNRDLVGWATGRELLPPHEVEVSRILLAEMSDMDPHATRLDDLLERHLALVEYLQGKWELKRRFKDLDLVYREHLSLREKVREVPPSEHGTLLSERLPKGGYRW